jgi:hypothetical protein
LEISYKVFIADKVIALPIERRAALTRGLIEQPGLKQRVARFALAIRRRNEAAPTWRTM